MIHFYHREGIIWAGKRQARLNWVFNNKQPFCEESTMPQGERRRYLSHQTCNNVRNMCHLPAGVTEISSEMKQPERVIPKSLSILKAHHLLLFLLPALHRSGVGVGGLKRGKQGANLIFFFFFLEGWQISLTGSGEFQRCKKIWGDKMLVSMVTSAKAR